MQMESDERPSDQNLFGMENRDFLERPSSFRKNNYDHVMQLLQHDYILNIFKDLQKVHTQP